jgi:hypothetical protein
VSSEGEKNIRAQLDKITKGEEAVIQPAFV